MNETARKVLSDELDKWIIYRQEKQEQAEELSRRLDEVRNDLKSYDRHITGLQEALENA